MCKYDADSEKGYAELAGSASGSTDRGGDVKEITGILGPKPDLRVLLIGLSGWAHQLLFALLDLLPPPLRGGLLTLVLKRIGRNSWVDYGAFIRYPWTCSIGSGTIVNHGCRFYGSYHVSGVRIEIGDHCAIAPNVQIYTAGHDYGSFELTDVADSVVVGNNVWVGGGAVLLPGVHVGDGAIVGAGTLVTKDVPAYSIAVGVPARIIGQRRIGQPAEEALANVKLPS